LPDAALAWSARARQQTLETVKHHLGPNRQASDGTRHRATLVVLSRLMLYTSAPA
jgi:hypothetical protein